jgi:hypothetical protein
MWFTKQDQLRALRRLAAPWLPASAAAVLDGDTEQRARAAVEREASVVRNPYHTMSRCREGGLWPLRHFSTGLTQLPLV